MTDWGDFSLRAFDRDGVPLWVSGREGQGPGEFLGFWDLEYDANGRLQILDSRNRRVTILDSAGQVESTIGIFLDTPVAQLFPFSWNEGNPVFVSSDKSDHIWEAVDEDGSSVRYGPKLGTQPLPGLVSEAWAESLPDGGAVLVFRWSDTMVFLDGRGSIRQVIDGVEPIPFPNTVSYTPTTTLPSGVRIRRVTRVDPSATIAVRAAAVGADRLFLLFEGRTEDAGQILDTYSLVDGAYAGSYRLPTPVNYITMLTDNRLATLENEFLPTVRLWRLPTVTQPTDRSTTRRRGLPR